MCFRRTLTSSFSIFIHFVWFKRVENGENFVWDSILASTRKSGKQCPLTLTRKITITVSKWLEEIWTNNSNFIRHIANRPADRTHNKTCYNMCRSSFSVYFCLILRKPQCVFVGFFLLLSFELQKYDKSPLRLRLRSLVSCIHCSFASVFFKGTHIPILHNPMACCRFFFVFQLETISTSVSETECIIWRDSIYVLPFRISQRCDEFDRIVSHNLPSPNNKTNVFPHRTFTFVAWVECAANWQGRFKSFYGSAEFRDRCFFFFLFYSE